MARTDTWLSLKIKVSPIQDQSSDREVTHWSREELSFLRSRCRLLEGEDPVKSKEETDDQLSVLCELTKVGNCETLANDVRKRLSSLDHTGAWCKKSQGPTALQHGKHAGACSGQQPSCAIAAPAILDRRIDVQHACGQVLGRVARELWEPDLHSTKAIHAHGTVSPVPRPTTAISRKRTSPGHVVEEAPSKIVGVLVVHTHIEVLTGSAAHGTGHKMGAL